MATIGIEWVNKYNGTQKDLKNNDDNARGFYNTLSGVRRFDYGDDLAWDRDFEESGVGSPAAGTDQLYADDVDIVFFSGHGSMGGPVFGIVDKDDGRARPSDMRLGNRDCEWIVFDACQVLERDNLKIFNRLRDCFVGLHYMLGFDTTCGDTGDRGKKFAERLNDGWTIRDAWIRACTETEDSDTNWAYMRADAAGTDTFNDHWHGKGFVSADPVNPTSRLYLRGAC
jgi:hypothetical protein